MKITDDLMEAITCLPQNWHFVVNKDEWYTKEGCGKCIACTVVWQKAPLELKWSWTVKKIKPVALAIVELRESEGIRQAGS